MKFYDHEAYTVPQGWTLGKASEGEHRTIRQWLRLAVHIARELGKLDSLVKCLQNLKGMQANGTEVHIFTDFAPLSFTWSWVRRKRRPCDLCYRPFPDCPDCHGTGWVDQSERLMMGGLLFHSRHDGNGNGAAPSYAVCIDDGDGWRLHS